jgi:hypothetical protein
MDELEQRERARCDGEERETRRQRCSRGVVCWAPRSPGRRQACSPGAELAAPSPASAQTVKSPAEALQALMDGNQRFFERKLTFYQEDLAILQQNTAEKQEPFASVLSCADSRVPVELLFDQSIGHVFVNRVAGNRNHRDRIRRGSARDQGDRCVGPWRLRCGQSHDRRQGGARAD